MYSIKTSSKTNVSDWKPNRGYYNARLIIYGIPDLCAAVQSALSGTLLIRYKTDKTALSFIVVKYKPALKISKNENFVTAVNTRFGV